MSLQEAFYLATRKRLLELARMYEYPFIAGRRTKLAWDLVRQGIPVEKCPECDGTGIRKEDMPGGD